MLAVIALAAVWSGGLWLFKRRAALRNAQEVYEDWTRESPHALHGLDADRFRAAFMRAHGPGGQATTTATLVAVLAATPLILILFRLLWSGVWIISGRAPFYEEGLLMWRFALFFAVVAGWAAIAAAATRIYYRRAPGSLREEILHEAARKPD